ncbi:hypothetical protein [Bdellovibrio sp. HCB209]|uniref:hypothetical protein n=1 Tax=Bdellovibrio sp. HCB209 TaxID=3394354 RepID=UPI0039B5AD53
MRRIFVMLMVLCSLQLGVMAQTWNPNQKDTIATEDADDTKAGFISASLYLNNFSDIKFKNAEVTSGGVTAPQEYILKTEPSIGIDINFIYWLDHSWGFALGSFWDIGHKVKDESFDIFGTTKTAYLGLIGFDLSAIYRWERFYIPIGINVTFPILMIEDGDIEDVGGHTGWQVAMGYLFGKSKSDALEFRYRTSIFQYTQVLNNVTMKSESGEGDSFALAWKHFF